MSTHKPGTMFVATVRGVPNVRVLRGESSWLSERCIDGGPVHADSTVTDIRPLVVLDPSEIGGMGEFRARNLEGARSYGRHVREKYPCAGELIVWLADQIEAQTRPAEPTGIGALVEDDEGRHWARAKDGSWVSLSDGTSGRTSPWEFLTPVRVLSEGVAE